MRRNTERYFLADKFEAIPKLYCLQYTYAYGCRRALMNTDMVNSSSNTEQSTLFQGRYKIQHRIGTGKSGDVFSAYDKKTATNVAVKVFSAAVCSDPARGSQLKHKLKLGLKLRHPYVVKILDVDTDNEPYAIVMELLRGMTLRENIRMLAGANEGFDIREVVRIGCAVCEGLSAVHRWTVHLNINPENIFLCYDGTVKVMEFGVPPIPDTAADSESSRKIRYLAPEQGDGTLTADRRADQYALAVVLTEALSLSIPSAEALLISKDTTVKDPGLIPVLKRALSENPSDRYPDMHEFTTALQHAPRGNFLVKKIPVLIVVTALIFLGTMFVKTGNEVYPHLPAIFPAKSSAGDAEFAKSTALTWRKRWYDLNSPGDNISLQAELAQNDMNRARMLYSAERVPGAKSAFKRAGDLYRAAVGSLSRRSERREKAEIAHGKVEGIQRAINNLLSSGYIGGVPQSVTMGSEALTAGDDAYEDGNYISAYENYTRAQGYFEAGSLEIQKQLSLSLRIGNIRQTIASQSQVWNDLRSKFNIEESTQIDRAQVASEHADESMELNEFDTALRFYEEALEHYNAAISAAAKNINVFDNTSSSRERVIQLVQVWDELARNGQVTDKKFASQLRQQLSIGDSYFTNNDYGNAKSAYDAVAKSLETELDSVNQRARESTMTKYEDAKVLLEQWDKSSRMFSEKVADETDARRRGVLMYTKDFFDSYLYREAPVGIAAMADFERTEKLISENQFALAGVVLTQVHTAVTTLADIAGQIEAPLQDAYLAQRKAEAGRAILGPFATEIAEINRLFASGDQLLGDGKIALSGGDVERATAVFREAKWLYSLVFQQAPLELMAYVKNGADLPNKELALAAFKKVRDYKSESIGEPPPQNDSEHELTYVDTAVAHGRVRFNKNLVPAVLKADELISIFGVAPRKWGEAEKVFIFDNLGITAYIQDDGLHVGELRLYMSASPSNGWSPRVSYAGTVSINEYQIEPGQIFDTSVSTIAPDLIYEGVRVNSYGGINDNPNVHIARLKDSQRIEYIRIGFE